MKNNIPSLLVKNKIKEIELVRIIQKRGKKIGPSFLNKVISGNKKPPVWLLFAIANIFNSHIEDIFFPTYEEIYGNKNK